MLRSSVRGDGGVDMSRRYRVIVGGAMVLVHGGIPRIGLD